MDKEGREEEEGRKKRKDVKKGIKYILYMTFCNIKVEFFTYDFTYVCKCRDDNGGLWA